MVTFAPILALFGTEKKNNEIYILRNPGLRFAFSLLRFASLFERRPTSPFSTEMKDRTVKQTTKRTNRAQKVRSKKQNQSLSTTVGM